MVNNGGGGLVANLCLSLVTSWTVACWAPLSVGFLRQEYWSGLPFPSPGDLPNPGIEPASPALAGGLFSPEPPGKPTVCIYVHHIFLLIHLLVDTLVASISRLL